MNDSTIPQPPIAGTSHHRSTVIILLTIIGFSMLLAVALCAAPLYAAALHRSAAICDAVSEIPLVACQSLVALYESTDGSNWRNNTNWLLTATPCTWYGVTCSAGRITMLDLHGNQLAGELPAQLGDLTALRTLQLQNNRLSGPLPPALGNLTLLTDLRLFNNHLTGAIPPAVGNLRDLEQLWLAVNQFTGPLPAALGNLTNLVALRLEYNGFDDPIPTTLTSLANLHTDPYRGLDLGYNKLTATEPALVAFLNAKDPDWAQTQTVSPTDVAAVIQSIGRIELTWTAIAYEGDGGTYVVSVATTPGGPYTLHGTTADKTATSYLVGQLEPGTTYYLVVHTRTPAHGSQRSALEGITSPEVSAATPAIPTDFCATRKVAKKPPSVVITQPQTQAHFGSGELIALTGQATDLEDRAIPDSAFTWSYGGTIFATGRQSSAILPDVVHEVTLSVIDSDGHRGEDSIVIAVGGYQTYLPLVQR